MMQLTMSIRLIPLSSQKNHNPLRLELTPLVKGDGMVDWIATQTWTKVKKKAVYLDGNLDKTFGRIIERRDYLLFEDSRDAVAYRLSVG